MHWASVPRGIVATDPAPGTLAHFCYLTTKMWRYAMGVLLVFVITFSVFPGEITTIKYEGTFPQLDFLSVRTVRSMRARDPTWWLPQVTHPRALLPTCALLTRAHGGRLCW